MNQGWHTPGFASPNNPGLGDPGATKRRLFVPTGGEAQAPPQPKKRLLVVPPPEGAEQAKNQAEADVERAVKEAEAARESLEEATKAVMGALFSDHTEEWMGELDIDDLDDWCAKIGAHSTDKDLTRLLTSNGISARPAIGQKVFAKKEEKVQYLVKWLVNRD